MKGKTQKTSQNITSFKEIQQYRNKKSSRSTVSIKKDDLELYRLEKEDFQVVQSIWHYLESKIKEVPITCTWEWVSTWVEH